MILKHLQLLVRGKLFLIMEFFTLPGFLNSHFGDVDSLIGTGTKPVQIRIVDPCGHPVAGCAVLGRFGALEPRKSRFAFKNATTKRVSAPAATGITTPRQPALIERLPLSATRSSMAATDASCPN